MEIKLKGSEELVVAVIKEPINLENKPGIKITARYGDKFRSYSVVLHDSYDLKELQDLETQIIKLLINNVTK